MSTMLVALVGIGVLGMSADDAPPGLSDLVVKVEPTPLKTRTFSPLHVRVRVANDGEKPFQFPRLAPTGETGGIQFQYREPGGTWTYLRTNGQGRVCGEVIRPTIIPEKGEYVAREVLFCDEGNLVFGTSGTFEFRAILVLVYAGSYRYVISKAVPLEIVACSERHRKAIQQHKSAVQHVVEAECALWGATGRSSFPLEALRAARRDVDDEDVRQALRRAELYSLLAPAQEGETLDRKVADRAAEELSALAKESNPVVKEMIQVNLAAFFYRVGDAARGDRFRRGLNELGPDAFKLPPLRRVEGK